MRELRPDIVMLNVTYNDTGLIVSQARTLCLGAGKREEAKDYLRKVEFQGVTNRIRFDENGDVLQSTLSLLKLGTGKKWMEYK